MVVWYGKVSICMVQTSLALTSICCHFLVDVMVFHDPGKGHEHLVIWEFLHEAQEQRAGPSDLMYDCMYDSRLFGSPTFPHLLFFKHPPTAQIEPRHMSYTKQPPHVHTRWNARTRIGMGVVR